MIRLRFLPWWPTSLVVVAISATTLFSARLPVRKPATLFQPFQGACATLSRDGQRLAYLAPDGERWCVMLLDFERGGVRRKVRLDEISSAPPSFFGWTSGGCLGVAFASGSVFAVDAATAGARKVLDRDAFGTPGDRQMIPRVPRVIGPLDGEEDVLLVEGVAPLHEPTLENFSVYGLSALAETPGAAVAQASAVAAGERAPDMEAPLDPDAVLLNLNERERRFITIEVARLELRTGRWKVISSLLDQRYSVVLYDRRGRPRVMRERSAARQEFRYRTDERRLFAGWRELDRWLGEGAKLEFHVTPENFLGQRSVPLAFGHEPDVLYFASNVGRETYGLHALDLRTKQHREIALGDDRHDVIELDPDGGFSAPGLVFDRERQTLAGVRVPATGMTHWVDPEIAEVQAAVNADFPGRRVELCEWDDARTRFLVLVDGDAEPGRYFVYQRSDGRWLECLRRAPWLDPEQANAVEPFAFTSAAGVRLTGRVTIPRVSLVLPPPLVVMFHDGPWQATPSGFGREAQALADLGCMVLEVDYRGSSGRGWRHLLAIREGFDRAPVEDALAAMDWLHTRRAFNARRVVAAGEGFGGYLALRAVQRAPERFRCGISINGATDPDNLQEDARRNAVEREREMTGFRLHQEAWLDSVMRFNPRQTKVPLLPLQEAPQEVDFRRELGRWFFRRDASGARPTAVRSGGAIQQPVLLLHDPNHRIVAFDHAATLARQLRGSGAEVALVEIPTQAGREPGPERARVYARVAEFLNEHLYDFDVKIGELKEVK